MRHSPSTSTLIVGRHTLARERLAALLQDSTFKVIASAGRASDVRDIHVASDCQLLAIITVDGTASSLAEAADDSRILRTRFTCPTIVVVAETRNPVDIRQIASLAPTAYIDNVTARELLLKVLDLSRPANPTFGGLPSS